MAIGPMQMIVAGFKGDVMESPVIEEIFAASWSGDIKVIDLLVIEKDENGDLYGVELSDVTLEEEILYGALIGGLIGLGADGEEGVVAGARAGAEFVAETGSVLGITPYDINGLVFSLPEGQSGIVVLFEQVWARNIHEATIAADGQVLGQALIEPEGLVLLGAEMRAALEAAAVVEAAEIVELQAMLEAEEAVAISEAIREEAARKAIAALIAAEIIEEAAIEDATQVVAAALAVEESVEQD